MTTPEERKRYWYNRNTRRIHESSCLDCLMNYDGHEKKWENPPGNRSHWWGPYETLGAAIDVAASTRGEVIPCGNGCVEWPSINTAE